ncbi:RagB/SusD family nutrient uptake outer membrane protein [Chryseobacterium wanjuense]
MSSQGMNNGLTSLSQFAGLSADEFKVADNVSDQLYTSYYTNSLTSTNTTGNDFWMNIYSSYLFIVNSSIEGLTDNALVSEAVRNQLLGECFFLRAFSYFYLVNLYGDVPLVLSSDYKKNSNIGRSPKAKVYDQIVTDLKNAETLLNTNYVDNSKVTSTSKRVVPNKAAAKALLSRVYLYGKDWGNAENKASEVIEDKGLYDTVPVHAVFLVDSKEVIWQIQSVSDIYTNAAEAYLFKLPPTGPDPYSYRVYLSENINQYISYDDKRRSWVDSVMVGSLVYYFPVKYKNNESFSPVTEYSVVMRLAELYLIRSEARTHLNKTIEALSDLNVIRQRAGVASIQSGSQDQILNKILQERRSELFTEWGHRWLDLKRTGKATAILQPVKGASWTINDELYPIPQADININLGLRGQQNPGY